MKNAIIRTISGIAFTAIVIFALLYNKYAFACVFAIFDIFMLYEFYNMTMKKSFRLQQVLAILTAVILFALCFLIASKRLDNLRYLYLSLCPVLILMISTLKYNTKEAMQSLSNIYTALVYIGIPMALLNFLVFNASNAAFNGLLVLSLLIIIWASDVGAFVFGVSLGQRFGKKLAPKISPKKSWIGFWGGLLSSVIAAILLSYFKLLNFSIIHCIIIAVIIDVCGVCGDLYESQWKRCSEIKDSGYIIPGHGGVLDRFDSSLFAIPAALIYMIIFNLI